MSTSATPTAEPTVFPRTPDGVVNWRSMLFANELYVKNEHKDTVARLLGKPVEAIRDLTTEDVAKVDDRYLVVKKAGILRLARLRGYSSALPDVKHVQRDYVVVQTWVEWDAFDGKPGKRTGGVGEATPENTTQLGAAYLASTAQNRAFARAVRDFLEIDIVCSDELGRDGKQPEQEDSRAAGGVAGQAANEPLDLGPAGSLQRAARDSKRRFTFEEVKQAALSRWQEDCDALATKPELEQDPKWKRRIESDPNAWEKWGDIVPRDCLTLITLIKAADAADAKAGVAAPAAGSVPNAPSGVTVPGIKPRRITRSSSAAPAMAEAA